MRHCVIGGRVLQQVPEVPVDLLLIRSDQPQHAGFNAFRPLGRVAHHENGAPERGTFLLDAAGIGQTDVTPGFKVMAVRDIHRLNDMDSVTASEFL